MVDSLRQALLPLRERIRAAFIFGSIARGDEHSASDVDLMVIGDVSLADVVDVIWTAEQCIARPVNPTVYPPEEFAARLAAGHHFVTKVVKHEKLMLMGDESDIAAFDVCRRKRHSNVYDQVGAVSEQEADEMVAFTKTLRTQVVAWLRNNHPGLCEG